MLVSERIFIPSCTTSMAASSKRICNGDVGTGRWWNRKEPYRTVEVARPRLSPR
jgi:hypothetical protein